MNWFDSHCHLEGFLKKGIVEQVLSRAKLNFVTRMTVIGTSSKDWTLYKNISLQYKSEVYYSIGLHPCYVAEGFETEIEQLEPFLFEYNKPVAIGEIGLDYFHLPKEKSEAERLVKLQKLAFLKQVKLASSHNMPIVVHSRNSFSDCVKILDDSKVNWHNVVFHCFSEGLDQIKILNDRGGRASFTGILTYKKNDFLREALLEQGLENLMLETDSPYLAPEPLRGKENEPANLSHIGDFISKKYAISTLEVANQSFQNTNKFYNIA